jgi:predicted nucleic acid-binding protein
MHYLLDTVTLIRHFSGEGHIGKTAQHIFDQAEISGDSFFISVITLMEVMYLAEKNRIPVNLGRTIDKIRGNTLYAIVDLSADILQVAQEITFYELHDRLILATAKWLDIPVISSDKKFHDVDKIQVVWG